MRKYNVTMPVYFNEVEAESAEMLAEELSNFIRLDHKKFVKKFECDFFEIHYSEAEIEDVMDELAEREARIAA
jgi:hypothetical protein